MMLLCLAIGLLSAVPRNLVIVEVATGTWCTYCPGAAMACHDLLTNGNPVAIIKNHNGDSYANTYSAARNSLYGISSYPTAKFDGVETHVGGSSSSSIYSSYLPKVNTRMAVASRYSIGASGSNVGNQYTVNVSVAKPEADSNTNVKLHAVLTESGIPQTWFNQTTVENVNRLMIPDQNGTAINLNTGEQTSVQLNFTKQASWVADNCELILFLQNMTTKEILQGIKYPLNNITGGYPLSLEQYDFPLQLAGPVSSTSITIQNYASYAVNGTIAVNNPVFSLSTGSYSIPAFGSQNFQVFFSPQESGDFSANLTLTGNLWNYPNISIPLTGSSYRMASDFVFPSSNEPYQAVSGGTALGSETSSNRCFVDPNEPLGGVSTYTGPGFPIGFDFNFLGRSFDRIAVHTHGWISLGQSAVTPSVNMSSSSTSNPLGTSVEINPAQLVNRIAAMGYSLRARTGGGLSIVQLGTAPNRECVIQWNNYRRTINSSEILNFQIRLLENGNRVKIIYGDMTHGSASTLVAVGLRSMPSTDPINFHNLSSTTSWIDPDPGTTATSRMTYSLDVTPSNGLTYTWTPRASFPQMPALLSPANGATGLPTSGFDLTWTSIAGGSNPEYYAVYLSDNPDEMYDQYYWETSANSFNPVTDGDFNFDFNQRWFWTVQAFNASGSVLSETIYRFDTEQSLAPESPLASISGDGSLSWTAIDGADSYNIYRADTPNGDFSMVGNTGSTSWTDPAFSTGSAFYKVTTVVNGREIALPLK